MMRQMVKHRTNGAEPDEEARCLLCFCVRKKDCGRAPLEIRTMVVGLLFHEKKDPDSTHVESGLTVSAQHYILALCCVGSNLVILSFTYK